MKNKKNTITTEHIQAIMDQTAFETSTIGDKTTIVHATLPNGFVIVESSSCVDPENYDLQIGRGICLERIKDKIWELEGYRLQSQLAEQELFLCRNPFFQVERDNFIALLIKKIRDAEADMTVLKRKVACLERRLDPFL